MNGLRTRPPGGSSPNRAGTDGELRRVSILFADIINSTAMLQRLDPEAAAALLDPPMDAMKAAVERFGGTTSHLGDGILAVFGAPSTCEDHAVRACLTALAIQAELAALATVQARIGIHTGDVVMRERRIGRAQIWEPVGAALTVAARIEQGAPPGGVLLSASTAALARGFVEVAPLPALQAKGFDEPLPVSRLLRADPGASRWSVRAAVGLVGMVGRTTELAQLRAFLADAETPGTSALLVHGEPGIGKSRLLHEALRPVDGGDAHVVRLSGDPHRADAAFHPFGVWLRGTLDVRAGDGTDAARNRVADRTRRVPGLTDAGRTALLRILGLAGTAVGEVRTGAPPAAAAAVLALWRNAAGGRRLVLACEDLDCFDEASGDLLSAILAEPEAEGTGGLRLAGTARTRVRLAGAGSAGTIHLQPLPPGDALSLLHRIDGRFAERPDLAVRLRDKTGGNPLFLEEIGASAAAVLDGVEAEPALGGEPEQLPDQVEALIADRLRRLPRALRQVVQLCAVVGETVPLRLTARLAGLEEARLHPQLLRLQAEGVLTETRRYPDPEFAFRHGLTRDVAYRAILAARRRELHGRAAALLEADAPGADAGRLDDLCFHAAAAADWPRAVTHLRAAAALAAGKSAFQVARLRLDQALAASGRLPDDHGRARDQLAMLMDLRMLLNAAGRYADVATALDRADTLARRVDDTTAAVRIAVQRVHLLNIAGRMDEAVELGREAVADAAGLDDTALLVLAAHNLAQAHYNKGDMRACEAVLAKVAGRLESEADGRRPGSIGSLSVLVHVLRSLSLAFAGDADGARTTAALAQAGATAAGRPYDLAWAALAAGVARLRAAPAEAADVLLDGIAICESGQIAQATPALQAALGHALLRLGQWADAASWLAKAYAASLEQTRSMVMCWAACGLARALWELDDRDTARRLAAEAVDTARSNGYRAYLAVTLRAGAALQPPAEAAVALREAAAVAAELGLAGEQADCAAALAALSPPG